MNFRAMAYHIVKKTDTSEETSQTEVAIFILFCIYYAYEHQGDISSSSFKNDLSWLLWAIVQKHQKARNNIGLINTLLFLGADPGFKVTSAMPSVTETLSSSRLSSIERQLLKECLSTVGTNQSLIRDIPAFHLAVTNRVETKHKPQKNTSLSIRKDQTHFHIDYSDPDAASQLIGIFLWIGYTSGAEHIVAQHPGSIKKLKLEICTHALVGHPEQFDLIYDDALLKAEVLEFIAKYLLTANASVTKHIYTLINNKYPVEVMDTGVNCQALLHLAQTNNLEIFKVLVSSYNLDFSYIRLLTKSKDLALILFHFLRMLRPFCTSHEYIVAFLNWIKKNHKNNFSSVMEYFWKLLANEIAEKKEFMLSTRTLVAALIKERLFDLAHIEFFLVIPFLLNRNDLIEMVIAQLTDHEFLQTFESGDFYLKLNLKISKEQAEILLARYNSISKISGEKPSGNTLLISMLAGIGLHSNNLDVLELTLMAGHDPHIALANIVSLIAGVIINGSNQGLETMLKYKPFDLLSMIDTCSFAAVVSDLALPSKVSPINLATALQFNAAEKTISEPKITERSQEAYFNILRAKEAPREGSSKRQEIKEPNNECSLEFREITAPQHVQTSKCILLIDSHFKLYSEQQKVQWLLTNREAIITTLDLKQNPGNYSRLLGTFIAGGRHDLLSLFLQLKLPIDVPGIRTASVEYRKSSSPTYHISTFRPLTFAAWEGDLESVKLLKEAGAELMIHEKDEHAPISWAMQAARSVVIDYLLDNIMVSDSNQSNTLKFLTDFQNHLRYGDFTVKAKFLMMAKRCSIRCLLTLAMLGILDADNTYLAENITQHADATLIEICETILNLLFSAYRAEQDRKMTLSFVKKALTAYEKLDLYDILRTIIYNLNVCTAYDKTITKSVADFFLEEIINHAITLPAIQKNDHVTVVALLTELNNPRFIRLVTKFLPAIKVQAGDAELLEVLVALATTAIKSKDYVAAASLLEKSSAYLSLEQSAGLLWEITQNNEATLATILLGAAQESKTNIAQLVFLEQPSDMCCFTKATQYRNNLLLQLFSTYLLNESNDLSCYSIQLFKSLNHARNQGNIRGGEIICQIISSLTPIANRLVAINKSEETTDEQPLNQFSFTTPDTNKTAKVTIEGYELNILDLDSMKKLAQIFKDSIEGRAGSIRTISKYREFGIHYKIRFFDPKSGDRRGYLKQKSSGDLQYEFFSAAKHR